MRMIFYATVALACALLAMPVGAKGRTVKLVDIARHYEVSFYEELGPHHVQMMYVVDYVPNHPGRGAIFLPGRGDVRYRLNTRTILRDGRDGRWFPASDEWERVVGSRAR